MGDVQRVVTLGAAVGCLLMGGVFYAFSTFVMSGLRRAGTAHGLPAMQSINVTAQRPGLMILFFGTLLLCLVAGGHGATDLGQRAGVGQLLGALAYVLGSFGVTAAVNVPMNNALDRVDATAANAVGEWERYARRWSVANHVRLAFSGVAGVLLILAAR